MKVFSIVILVTIVATVAVASCPDGSYCDGECCKRFVIGTAYWCCRGIFHCKRFLGVGYCFLFSEPSIQNSSSLAVSMSEREHNDDDASADSTSDISGSDELRSEPSGVERSPEPRPLYSWGKFKKIVGIVDTILRSPADVGDASEDSSSSESGEEYLLDSRADAPPLRAERSPKKLVPIVTPVLNGGVLGKFAGLIGEILKSPEAPSVVGQDLESRANVDLANEVKDSPVVQKTASSKDLFEPLT